MNAPRRGRARLLIAGAALVVVLVGVAFAARALLAPAVKATTPPDGVRVVVSEDKGTGYDAQGGPILLAHPIHTVVYQRTLTDRATVTKLQADVNEPADGRTPLPRCRVDAPNAASMDGAMYTYDFVFTAHGIPVEHAVVSYRCLGASVRRGFAPSLSLSGERGAGPDLWRICPITVWTTDLEPGPDTLHILSGTPVPTLAPH